MSVTVDQRATASASTSLANGSTFSFTNQTITAALANGGLLVLVVDNSTATTFQCNWDTGGTNQLMTQVGSFAVSGQNIFAFSLANPTSGNKTLGVKRTSGSTASIDVYSVSVTGADQNVLNWSLNVTTTSGSGTAVSLSISCPAGSYAFSVAVGTSATITANVGPTLRFGTDSLTSPATTIAGGDSLIAGTTANHSWTLSVSNTFDGLLIAVPPPPTPWFDGVSVGAGSSPDLALRKPRKQAFPALSGGDDGIAARYVRWQNAGSEVQSFQPPHRGNERKAGAIMPREDGIERPFIRFFPTGFEVQPFQPPHRGNERKAGAIMPREDGIERPEIVWFNFGWEVQPPQPPNPYKPSRYSSVRAKSEFAIFPPWLNYGWEIQSPQPPNPGQSNIARNNIRFAATTGGDQGIEATFVPPAGQTPTWGFEFTFQPPYQRRRLSTPVEDGAEGVYSRWQNFGWGVQDVQPPNPWTANLGRNNVRFAALVGGDPGTEAGLINWFNAGWEVQPPQPPHPRPERSGALATGDSGIENRFVASFVTSAWGFDAQPYQPQRVPRPGAAVARGDEGIELPLINFFPAGWEEQSVQPPHPRWEKAGAVMPREDGTEGVFLASFVTSGWGFDPQPFQPPHRRIERAGAVAPVEQGNEFPFVNFYPSGFDFSWQPPNPFSTNLARNNVRAAALAGGDQGTEFTLVAPVSVTSGWGFEPQLPTLSIAPKVGPRIAAIKFKSEFAVFAPFSPFGFEVQSMTTVKRPRPERSGAVATGDPGIEGTFTFVGTALAPYALDPTNVVIRPQPVAQRAAGAFGSSEFYAFTLTPWVDDPQGHWYRARRFAFDPGFAGTEGKFAPPSSITSGWGFDPQPVQPPRRYYRAGAIARSDDGNELPQVNFFPMGWEVATHQPAHPRPEQRHAAIARGDDGSEFPLVNFYPHGWPIAPHQPGHPRPERSGAIMPGEPGIEGTYTFVSLTLAPWGYQPWEPQPPHPRREKAGAIMPREDGSEFPLVNFFPHNWPVAPHQPAHPRPEKSGALAAGDQGIEAAFQPPPTLAAYAIDLSQLLRYRRLISAAQIWNQDPVQPFNNFLPSGFEVAPMQPPHPRPERSGAIARGDDGVEAKLPTPPLAPWGFEPIPMHIRVPYNRGGAFLRGAEGIDAPFVRWIVRGWDQTESTQRARPRVFGAIQSGFPVEGVYVFVPLPVFLYTQNTDGVLVKRRVNIGAAMPFEVGWSLPRLPNAVFYATSVLSQGTGATVVSAAGAQTVVKAEPVGR
jgi:hypothetical protein